MTLNGDAKFEEKTDLLFGKGSEDYSKFSPAQFKVSRLG